MIRVTKLDGTTLVVNSDLILTVEMPHDTIVTFVTGEKLRVLESAEEVVARAAHWRRTCSDLIEL